MALRFERAQLNASDFVAGRDNDTSLDAGQVGEIGTAEIGEDGSIAQYEAVQLGQPASNRTGDRKGNELFVNVYDSTDTLITQPGNYTWISSNGTIDIQRNGELDGEPSADITYGYQDATEDQVALQGLFAEIPQTLGLIIPVFIVLLFLRALVG